MQSDVEHGQADSYGYSIGCWCGEVFTDYDELEDHLEEKAREAD